MSPKIHSNSFNRNPKFLHSFSVSLISSQSFSIHFLYPPSSVSPSLPRSLYISSFLPIALPQTFYLSIAPLHIFPFLSITFLHPTLYLSTQPFLLLTLPPYTPSFLPPSLHLFRQHPFTPPYILPPSLLPSPSRPISPASSSLFHHSQSLPFHFIRGVFPLLLLLLLHYFSPSFLSSHIP